MMVTVIRMQFRKLKPKVLFYRKLKPKVLFYWEYKKFFKFFWEYKKLGTQSYSPDENGFLNFCKIYTETLNEHAPRKRKTIRRNQSPFINKGISKALMKRTELHNKFL